MVNEVALELERMNSRSEGEKSPSGPTSTHKDLVSWKFSDLSLFLELISANKSSVDPSIFFKKSLSLITSKISGGSN